MKLPDMPARIAKLPKDERGYPVPWFASWIDGKPDFRVVEPGKIVGAHKKGLCWICGEPLGVHRVFVIGPMCVVNRVTSEPASHRDCAEFAAKACPFLTHPRRGRDDRDLPDGVTGSAGIMIERNPGVTALYETRKVEPFWAGNGVLFRLGDPSRVDFWTEGRPASRAEVWASIESGYPRLFHEAKKDGIEAIDELGRMMFAAMDLLPKAEAVAS